MISLKEIIHEITNIPLNESVYDKGLFKSIFLSGIPGSGKSYVLDKISDGNIQPRVVNTDKLIEYYSKEFNIDINNETYFNYFKDDVKKVTVNQLASYINGMLPLFVDGTSGDPSSLFRRDGILKSFGYDTGMIWIETDIELAIKRAESRDRQVPRDFIIHIHKTLQKNKDYYKSHFKYFGEIKNSDGELNNTEILKAYKNVSGFFKSPIENPIGSLNYEKAKKGTGYLVGSIYENISKITNICKGWYKS